MDGDKRYDINEGLGSFAVSARNNTTGTITTTQTSPTGGYELELASGSYTVSFSSDGFTTTTQQVSINSKNVKLDLIDPITSSGTSSQPAFNTISGTSGSDTLMGTSGADVLSGLSGNDKLYGNAGNDKIDGGSHNDKLWGNAGTDTLTGGAGHDIFVFNASFIGAIDKITDFSPVDDTIHLENTIFTNLITGSLNAAAFHIGTAAHDTTDRIIYNTQTGALSYDADGIGGGSAQQFAQLTGGLILTHADFYVI